MLLSALSATFLATIGLEMAAFALVIVFWDSRRLLVSLLVSGGFIAAALMAVLVLVVRLRSRAPILEHTLAELRQDRHALKGEG